MDLAKPSASPPSPTKGVGPPVVGPRPGVLASQERSQRRPSLGLLGAVAVASLLVGFLFGIWWSPLGGSRPPGATASPNEKATDKRGSALEDVPPDHPQAPLVPAKPKVCRQVAALTPDKMEVGDVGELKPVAASDMATDWLVVRVVDANNLIVRGRYYAANGWGTSARYNERFTGPVWVVNQPTRGLVDDRKVELTGRFIVSRTRTLDGGQTVFVVEPFTGD
jgi:hypothetical protein